MEDDASNLMEWVVHQDGPVATVKFEKVEKTLEEFIEHHMSLALALEKVRFDDSIRVVILTGRDDGIFERGPMRGEIAPWPRRVLQPSTRPTGPGSLRGPWNLSQGIERTFAALVLMEKPVIGRLNGDAYGFALHALWGCDIIIAREDVIVCDNHLTMHPTMPYALSAGDGAFAFLPLFMTPTKLKEFLMLGPRWTARQLADLGAINYAVSADGLDAKVDEFVEAFLARPPLPLMRTKRAVNKRLMEQMNLTFDYAWLAESTDFWELSATDFQQQMTLRPDEPLWSLSEPDTSSNET